MSNINWDKSFFLTAQEIALLGLDGVSINDQKEDTDEQTNH